MRNDPHVEEARQAGQQYIDSLKGDWKAIIADLQRRAHDEGRHIVTPPPRLLKPSSQEPKKKAG